MRDSIDGLPREAEGRSLRHVLQGWLLGFARMTSLTSLARMTPLVGFARMTPLGCLTCFARMTLLVLLPFIACSTNDTSDLTPTDTLAAASGAQLTPIDTSLFDSLR